ncbi:related to peptidylprolyl isomerase (cyclophilin)-like [Ramularia collo-cygni]|uniref:Peptidyl-prolyl cis-trans isomerase-like 2 n=1 Tax=Ramularia collo-cygni TaxID=112498 RepID=A0A2D3V0M0_9PEZI|nr:related to peptidylprolyl isomerase (cyclophilin)-like [Ramularia collo-cygni]CZT19030.1 related to peptidylprolyl isomerase (cyclophilin)-like [Ramularia collo-cygni]
MGKGTDKLYITHSEWSSEDAFGASAGANARKAANLGGAGSFKRLPFNFCSVSLQPFEHPVCTAEGTIFDLTNILPWIKKHGTNPVNGESLKSSDLIKLHFTKNDEGEFVDPVTFKVITDNTHLLAIRNTGNVFSYDTIERLNIKAKNWRDLINDAEFKRSDLITLQDPQNIESRNLASFKYIKDGTNTLTAEQQAERSAGVNDANLGSASKILKAKEAVAKARAEREQKAMSASQSSSSTRAVSASKPASQQQTTKPTPYNAAQYTNGQAAASFTSTGLTPSTSTARAIMSDEEYMLKPKRIRTKGYARMTTSKGAMNIELLPEFAPKAVWNFIQLSKKGYYNGVAFHRNIKNFMIQGGDPTGTGRGGQSCWGKSFADEFEGPATHDGRGVMSMANKGKDTNTSQFFLLYRRAAHLDRKHTVFGRVVEGLDVLDRLEQVEVGDGNRPIEDVLIEEVKVYVDPFEDFLKARSEKEAEEARLEKIRQEGGAEDERTTWTGKRVRADGKVESQSEAGTGVGKYLKQASAAAATGTRGDEVVGEWDEGEMPPPAAKKAKRGGGFGNFDGW